MNDFNRIPFDDDADEVKTWKGLADAVRIYNGDITLDAEKKA